LDEGLKGPFRDQRRHIGKSLTEAVVCGSISKSVDFLVDLRPRAAA